MSSPNNNEWLLSFIDQDREQIEFFAANWVYKSTAQVKPEHLPSETSELIHECFDGFVQILESGSSDLLEVFMQHVIQHRASLNFPVSVLLKGMLSFRVAITKQFDTHQIDLELRGSALHAIDAIYRDHLYDFCDRYQSALTENLLHTTSSLDQAEKDLSNLNSFALSLTHPVGLDDLLMTMADSIAILLGLDDCVVYLVQDDYFIQKGAYDPTQLQRRVDNPITIPSGRGVVGKAVTSQEAQRIDDIRSTDDYWPSDYPGRSELAVPVLFEGKVLAVFDSESTTLGFYNDRDQRMLEAMTTIAAPRIAAAITTEHNELLLKEAIQAAERRNRFFQTLSHEIRTPLTAILSSTEILQEYGDRMSSEERTQRHKKVVTATGLLNRLVNQILTLRDATSTDEKQLSQRIDIREHIMESVEALFDYADRGPDLVTEFDLTTTKIYTDPDLLYQIITNLTSNSIKYSNPGSKIRIQVTSTNHEMAILVQDHGNGIPPTEMESIFDDYFRASNRGQVSGAGLGLTIVQAATTRLGGSCQVESKLEEGTTFIIKLPIQQNSDRP